MKKVLFVFLIPLFLYSQSLEELVNLSIQNRLIESNQNKLESLKYEYESIKSGYLPKLDLGAGYGVTDDEVPNVPHKAGNVYGSVNYNLYDGGKRYDIYDSYEASIKSNEKTLDAMKNDIALTVITYYFNYLSYLAQKDAKLKEIEQLNAQLERIHRYFKAGTVTEDELQKIISSLEAAQVQLKEIDLNLITILHDLEYITGTKVNIISGSNVDELQEIKDASNRFDIQSLEYDTKARLSDAKAEKSGYLPTITLDNTFTYYDRDYNFNSNNLGKIQGTDFDHQNVASANLKWNIFSFGETKYKYESKFKQYLASRLNLDYEKNKANVDLQLALSAYEISKAKVVSAQASLKAAQSAYEIIKSKYENGLVDNVAFLMSLSEKFNALSVYQTSLNDIEIKRANIIYQCGEKLEEYIK